MTKVKVCGITRPEQAERIAEIGADWIGVNFWPKSPRSVSLELGKAVAASARSAGAAVVGVFVNQDSDWIAGLLKEGVIDWAQLHGDEDDAAVRRFGAQCIRAVRLKGLEEVAHAELSPAPMLLVDAVAENYGGSGIEANWNLAKKLVENRKKTLLAGGLTPDNVAQAIHAVGPYGVDVASGVESEPGVKDLARVQVFIDRVRNADAG